MGPSTHLFVNDSVAQMQAFPESFPGINIDVCYLDSWDLDWTDPEAAALHGLAEWRAICGLLSPSALVIIDDTPASLGWIPVQFHEAAQDFRADHGFLPGKGALVHQQLVNSSKARILWHGYNIVYELRP
jgi:hypothetical protein